jgi:NAD(P)H-flavin reductase
MSSEKQNNACSVNGELIYNSSINKEIFRLDFTWSCSAIPKAGQFFMIRPKRSAVFLGRPISMAKFLAPNVVTFLISRCGKGTQELAAMRSGEEAELIGPLGNTWDNFLLPMKDSSHKLIALVGGGIGLAPLNALLGEFDETPGYSFDTYAGFRTGFANTEERNKLLGMALICSEETIIATEDGKDGLKGRIPDFLEPEKYAAVCACGPEPMLKAVAVKCKAAGVHCFVSMERRMACGVGACLGCTVKTVNGNRRCCVDGPIFKADEVVFDE